ncbi:OmpA family protein, partial [Pseudactinotalea sp.]|uniref:OmpA family protein n=1 Tax=Pseudactinotalea sp. TaxID=1926260 RepID=UPI003B3B75E7
MSVADRTLSSRRVVRATVIAGFACSLLVIGLAPAVADDLPTSPPDEPEGGIPDPSAHVLTFHPEGHVLHYAAEAHVQYLGEGTDDEPNVIVLQSDILFDINSWELPDSAAERIAELVEDAPEGASVQVQGHTDSNPVGAGHDFDNQELSQERAQAVADA